VEACRDFSRLNKLCNSCSASSSSCPLIQSFSHYSAKLDSGAYTEQLLVCKHAMKTVSASLSCRLSRPFRFVPLNLLLDIGARTGESFLWFSHQNIFPMRRSVFGRLQENMICGLLLVPHSQAADGARNHVYMLKWNRLIPAGRRLRLDYGQRKKEVRIPPLRSCR